MNNNTLLVTEFVIEVTKDNENNPPMFAINLG